MKSPPALVDCVCDVTMFIPGFVELIVTWSVRAHQPSVAVLSPKSCVVSVSAVVTDVLNHAAGEPCSLQPSIRPGLYVCRVSRWCAESPTKRLDEHTMETLVLILSQIGVFSLESEPPGLQPCLSLSRLCLLRMIQTRSTSAGCLDRNPVELHGLRLEFKLL